ncbi:MAG: hypothetical protein JW914_04085 [Syntrophaceae bacterium]|nr:hypothetical protein [Syntrophaceae bacterium]
MVEDVPGVYYGDSNSTRVRVLFSHQGNQWQAFQSDCENSGCLSAITKSFPKEVVWYIGLDGCQIGKVTARTPNNFSFYAHIGLQDIFEGRAPVVGKSSYEFAGFGGRPVRRPLVAVSKQYFSDPQGWKRHKPTPKLIMQTLKIMRKSAPAVCKEGQSEKQQLIPFHYTQDDLEIRAHKSINGSVLLTVSMNDVFYCEGGDGDGGYDAQTFAISPTGKTYYLGPGLILVDAGDYNGDGSSELVMALSLYNRGGYVLFSNSFIEEARFEFGYH